MEHAEVRLPSHLLPRALAQKSRSLRYRAPGGRWPGQQRGSLQLDSRDHRRRELPLRDLTMERKRMKKLPKLTLFLLLVLPLSALAQPLLELADKPGQLYAEKACTPAEKWSFTKAIPEFAQEDF